MNYTVTPWNNFCRVFQLPETYPKGYCFNGGLSTDFVMVDWFYPVSDIPQAAVSFEEWSRSGPPIPTKDIRLSDLELTLVPFVQQKRYIIPGLKYLILYEFGGSTVFTAALKEQEKV